MILRNSDTVAYFVVDWRVFYPYLKDWVFAYPMQVALAILERLRRSHVNC